MATAEGGGAMRSLGSIGWLDTNSIAIAAMRCQSGAVGPVRIPATASATSTTGGGAYGARGSLARASRRLRAF